MTINLKHPFVSAKEDGTDASKIQPSNWNALHQLTAAAKRLMGRYADTDGDVQEISVGSGLDLSDAGVLSAPNARVKTLEFARNVYPTNSERLNTINADTTPAVSHGNAVPANRFGILTGSILGTSGSMHSNYTVPADTAYYVYSFVAYVPPGITGAQISGSIVLDGGAGTTFLYDWDNPLTASTSVYIPSGGAGITGRVVVENLGGGFRRFQNALKNTGRTTLYHTFGGSVAGAKPTLTGFQIVRVPDDGSSLRLNDYFPVGQYAKPYTNFAMNGGRWAFANQFPFRDVVVFSDSIWASGGGTSASGAWRMFDTLLEYFGSGALNSYGGYTTEQVGAEFDLQNTGGAFDNSLVIFNAGVNDGSTLLTLPGRVAVMAALDQRILALGHGKYKVIGLLLKHAVTASPGAEQTLTTNVSEYTAYMAYNAMLSAKYGAKFIDAQAISVASYNPLDSNDAAAYALSMRPPSLAPLTGDGIHPGPLENMVVGSAVVASIKNEYGVL